MRNLTDLYVPPTRGVIMANPKISKKRWFASHDAWQLANKINMSKVEINFVLLCLTGVLTLLLTNNVLVIVGISLAALTVAALLSVYAYPALAQFIGQYGEKKEKEYRRIHAPILVSALTREGLHVFCTKSMTPAEVLTVDNMPLILDENNIQYRLNYIQWDNVRGEMSLSAYLDDKEVKAEIKQDSKQRRIDFLIEQEEMKNGRMSEERKSGFVAALNRVL